MGLKTEWSEWITEDCNEYYIVEIQKTKIWIFMALTEIGIAIDFFYFFIYLFIIFIAFIFIYLSILLFF